MEWGIYEGGVYLKSNYFYGKSIGRALKYTHFKLKNIPHIAESKFPKHYPKTARREDDKSIPENPKRRDNGPENPMKSDGTTNPVLGSLRGWGK